MKARTWAAGLLAVGGLFLAAASARAEDTIRLKLPAVDDAPAVSLGKLSAEADTMDARYYRGFHGGGYYGGRGYYGGFYGRGYYGGFYGRYYPRYAFYRPYLYANYYSAPVYYPTPVYYSTPVYYPATTYYPIGTQTVSAADAVNLPNARETAPPPRFAEPQGDFRYDGGPGAPIPQADPAPARIPTPAPIPQSTVPLDGRPVSLPAQKITPVKLTYPAFGELPRTTQFAEDRALPVKK